MSNEDRDELGRFTEGNHPKTGFHTNPERRHNFPNRGRSFQLAAQKILDMTDREMGDMLGKAERGELTQAEQLALRLVAKAKDVSDPKQLDALSKLIDRVEGKPCQQVSTSVEKMYEPPVINIDFVGQDEE